MCRGTITVRQSNAPHHFLVEMRNPPTTPRPFQLKPPPPPQTSRKLPEAFSPEFAFSRAPGRRHPPQNSRFSPPANTPQCADHVTTAREFMRPAPHRLLHFTRLTRLTPLHSTPLHSTPFHSPPLPSVHDASPCTLAMQWTLHELGRLNGIAGSRPPWLKSH